MSGRTRSETMAKSRTPLKNAGDRVKVGKEKEKEKGAGAEMLSRGSRLANARNASRTPSSSRRERRIALKQDVDKLKKMLRHEEDVHRALERAFTRPLGTLPRLPPYLPPKMLELLAEVAVLEEEVVRLEEQVVNFRRGLYQEAIYISSSKKAIESVINDFDPSRHSSQCEIAEASVLPCNEPSSPSQSSTSTSHTGVSSSPSSKCEKRGNKPGSFSDDQCGKENQAANNFSRVEKRLPKKKVHGITNISIAKLHCKESKLENSDIIGSNPNRISEDLLRCLSNVFLKMSPLDTHHALIEADPSVSGFQESAEGIPPQDPYSICPLFGKRDIGPYKKLRSIDQTTINQNLIVDSSVLMRKLRLLLRRLELVDLRGMGQQEKLAFWINVYNSCIMNTILEHGIPATPHMVVALMQKAVINVGGHMLSAMTIEHFILRLPFDSKYAFSKVARKDEMAVRSNLGLDWPEPLVTFALSCGSWSSPAVRVYTASHVENELDVAKRDYLQAAIGISPQDKLAIPKLLDWYLLDFAKDVESLLDWICLQLPNGLRNDAVKCIERARQGAFLLKNVQVLPYEFTFRYLLAV